MNFSKYSQIKSIKKQLTNYIIYDLYLKFKYIMNPLFHKLRSGHKMPTIGLGTYTLKGDVLDSALRQAIQIGYRHIDTAPSYGNYSITHVISHFYWYNKYCIV